MNQRTLFKTKYGSFSPDGKEYVITNPRTPRPWSNVVSNGDAGFIVSQTGGGYSWRGNGQVNRLTRWEQDIVKDEWGKYIYIRDAKSGHLWSASWKPVCCEPDFYEVRHGAGYTVITSRNEQIESEWTLFVAPDDPVEVWKLTIRNLSRRQRTLQVFTYFEWGLGVAPDWHREFHKCFIETFPDPSSNSLFATKRLWEVPSNNGHWNVTWPYVAFHSVSVRPNSYDCSKEGVLGNYGSVKDPQGIQQARLRKLSGNQLDPVASIQVNLSLPPREEKSLCFSLGAADDRRCASSLAKKYHSVRVVDEALKSVKERWDGLLSGTSIETPDRAMNVMVNRWLKYQAIAGRLWGRNGYYQSGGAYGFRDQLQDSQVFLSLDPEQTKGQIQLHARHQFKDGSVYHWWHPLSEVGLPTQMTDDLLWLPFVVSRYIEETNDLTMLDLQEPFIDDGTGVSLYEHCVRAIEKVLTRFSPRGLPLIGAGDWNDGLSAAGLGMKGESIWLAEFLVTVLQGFIPIAGLRGDSDLVKRYEQRKTDLCGAINCHGWDGEWYCYGTKDSGERFGSKENVEGTIHLNPQTWAVISGVADHQRANQVMDNVVKRLEYKAGTLLLHPAYHTPDEHLGYLTRYAPGTRENGATYTHAATWSVVAMAKLGRAEDAYRLFNKINPVVLGAAPDTYGAEPYVTAGNIDGPDSRFYGRGGWTWYTGSAAWLYLAGLEWILGVRASLKGLVLNPCIPSQWKSFSIRRLFRGVTYNIEVRNPDAVSTGIKSVSVDGSALTIQKNQTAVVLPVFGKGSIHSVDVEMGPIR
ncbi:MAG: glycosyl hydrolase family 65 protein [Bacteroidota bacterium]